MDARHADRGVHAALRRPGRGVRAQRRGQRRAAHDRRALPGGRAARRCTGRSGTTRTTTAAARRARAASRTCGVYFDDNRNGRRDAGEYASHRTPTYGDGTYSLPIPTRYQEAGGELPPIVLERVAGVECSAPRDCAVTGLRSRSRSHHRGRSRRRAAGRDLPPRLRRLADRLPGEAAVVHAARRSGPDEHAAGRRRPRAQDVGGRQRLLAELLRRRARQVGRRPGHLRRHVAALRGHHVAGPPPRLRVGLAQLARGGGRRAWTR